MRSDPRQAEPSPHLETESRLETEQQVRALATSFAQDGESLEALYAALDVVIGSRARAEIDDLLQLATMAWADTFITRLNRLTCADPVTGLPSVHHLLTHLEGASRQPGGLKDLALIVIDLVSRRNDPAGRSEATFGRTLRLAVVADTLDVWFDGTKVVRAAISPRRVALLLDENGGLAQQTADLAQAITSRLRLAPDGHMARARVVPLPADLADAVSVIEGLDPSPGGNVQKKVRLRA